MSICMALAAIHRHCRELLNFLSLAVFFKMTGFAVLLCMGTIKLKIRFWVVEGNIAPSALIMAVFAAWIGIKFYIKIALMYICVAIVTMYSDVSETPFFLFFMAGKAGCCDMWTLEHEFVIIVLFYRKSRALKSIVCMAFDAILRNSKVCKLIVVIIFMAIIAFVVFNRIGNFRFMT